MLAEVGVVPAVAGESSDTPTAEEAACRLMLAKVVLVRLRSSKVDTRVAVNDSASSGKGLLSSSSSESRFFSSL